MKQQTRGLNTALFFLAAAAACPPISNAQNMPDHPTVHVQGRDWTPLSIVTGNMGTPADQEAQFPPFKVIGDIYYVGTRTLSSFLVVTPAGNILIDTTYERNVRTLQKSVEQLGFKFADTKIILGNHAHGDHMEGDALAKELTGAKVMVMAEDEPALRAMKPGGKEHPVDRVIHDGEAVTLGNITLTAHLTPGHTHGATAWTTTATEGGKTYNVVFFTSLRSPARISPANELEFARAFKTARLLPCDVPLGDHGREFSMTDKYAKMKAGGPNPFIDPVGCTTEIDIEEAMFDAIVEEQKTAAKP
jgi:metallo-beta-lactamase class B